MSAIQKTLIEHLACKFSKGLWHMHWFWHCKAVYRYKKKMFCVALFCFPDILTKHEYVFKEYEDIQCGKRGGEIIKHEFCLKR